MAFGAAPVRGTTGRRPASVRDPRRLQRRPHDEDVWNIADFEGSTHVSEPERVAIRELVELGLEDLPPTISKGNPFTFWDYRGGNFHKGLGMRIDLILANPSFAAAVSETFIDREARKTGTKAPRRPATTHH